MAINTIIVMENEQKGESSLLTFIIGLVAGGIGIYAGAWITLGQASISTAIFAAFIGAIVWGIASFFIGWMPLIGTAMTFIVWLGSINWLYPGGWMTALQIAIFAWIASLLLSFLVEGLGYTSSKAIGVPGA